MTRDLRRVVTYTHPREKVWHALTDAEALATWLMPNDFQPRQGHRFRVQAAPGPGFDGTIQCEVLELRPPERMVWSWRTGTVDTRITFTLDEVPGGTRLTFQQSGFTGLSGLFSRAILGGGFDTFYGRRLPAYLDGGAIAAAAARARHLRPGQRMRLLARLATRFKRKGG